MSEKYEEIEKKLKNSDVGIVSVAMIEGDQIKHSTEDWDFSDDLHPLLSAWNSSNAQFITILGKKYSILQVESERLVATSIQKERHVVGAKDDERIILTLVDASGKMDLAYIEVVRALASLSSKEPYMDPEKKLGKYSHKIPTLLNMWGALVQEVRDNIRHKGGFELEDIAEEELERIIKEKERRREELQEVLKELELKEDELASINLEITFETKHLYNEFQLVMAKLKIEKLLKDKFQIYGPFKVRVIKEF